MSTLHFDKIVGSKNVSLLRQGFVMHTQTRTAEPVFKLFIAEQRGTVFNRCCTYGYTKHCHLHIDCFLLMDASVSTVWCININNQRFRFVMLSRFYANGRRDVMWILISYGILMIGILLNGLCKNYYGFIIRFYFSAYDDVCTDVTYANVYG